MGAGIQRLGDFGSSVNSVEPLLPLNRSVATVSVDRTESEHFMGSEPLSLGASDYERDPRRSPPSLNGLSRGIAVLDATSRAATRHGLELLAARVNY
jgi:hypothetical protein